ncbi:FG-GAP-like repeat-containing protein [Streptomyces peucetius]|uniref:FG-GAP-like repeat-containing protein n=1 Tax=Streptomyces peucetius TaxID=1950 RepID=A0ABY6IA50_STRPE|nr:FG-GAP-like repeat-containing protein [Streptomyces peucetius]UYQ62839.1 FG-GAP-like repeat-containing protein [Streptomyces peucetius]
MPPSRPARQRRRLAIAGTLVATLTGGLLAATAGTAAAAAVPAALPTGTQADFNGDGFADLAVGAPLADVGTKDNAGAVVVLYGSANGFSGARRVIVHQDTPGVSGAAEPGDAFGRSVATGDLDGDGYTDVIAGTPSEAVGDRGRVGGSTVLWGGPKGLSGASWLPLPSYLKDSYVGRGVATGDFDGDGHTDVTVTGHRETSTYYGPVQRTGAPARHVSEPLGTRFTTVAGDLSGDGAAERLYPSLITGDPGGTIAYIRRDGSGMSADPEDGYTTTELTGADGDASSIGDIDGDGYGDLVVGDAVDPSAAKPTGHKGGRITVWYGGPNGPDPAQQPGVFHQDTAGVPGGGEANDRFGASVSVSDTNGDGYADVAVGAPGEALGSVRDAGAVTVLYGSAAGLTATGSQFWSQNSAGVPGGGETSDHFGGAVRLMDVTGDGRADLTVAAPDENDSGAIILLRGSASGVTASGAMFLSAAAVGLTVSNQGWFGSALGAPAEQPRPKERFADDFNGDGYRDTVVGAPLAEVSGRREAGAVTVLYGGPAGPTATRRQTLTQASPGIPGGPEQSDQFGHSVASADFDEDGYADLAVATPYEDHGTTTVDAGMVTVVWGGPRGLSGATGVDVSQGFDLTGHGDWLGIDLAATGGAPYAHAELLIVGNRAAALVGPFTRDGKAAAVRPQNPVSSIVGAASGDLNGDRTADHVLVAPLSDGSVYVNPGESTGNTPERLPYDATNAAIGDVNGDGFDDLVAGAPYSLSESDGPTVHKGGQVAVWFGSASGIDATTTARVLHQDTPGVPGAADGEFGTDVTVGDIDGDGIDDIAVGDPNKWVNGRAEAGSVTVLPGRANGPDGTGAYVLTQDSADVPGAAEDSDLFGYRVRLADMTGDGRADLMVSAPGENLFEGATVFLRGSSSGLRTAGSTMIMANHAGLTQSGHRGWGDEIAP